MPRRRRPRRSAGLLGVATVALSAAAIAIAPGAGASTGGTYVALGDSYSAGPLILPQSDPTTCLRSAVNYPGLLAKSLHVHAVRDVTCSSATTQNFAQPQKGSISGTAAPQYDALGKDDSLVTVGIGGNDIGLVGLAESCINLAPPPVGQSCAAKYNSGGVDRYSQRIRAFAPTFGTVVEHIRSLAPHAKIVLVGYPTAIRSGGCYPVQPILGPDASYIQAKIDQLNAVMRTQASAHHAVYVDTRSTSVGHDACALPGERWLEGLVPLSNAFPLHPNELGMRNDERAVLRALRA